MGEIMSRNVEISEHGAKPLVKVYTAKRLRKMFRDFDDIKICKRQPWRKNCRACSNGCRSSSGADGLDLIIKARKPSRRPQSRSLRWRRRR